jgi:hypothetical protein
MFIRIVHHDDVNFIEELCCSSNDIHVTEGDRVKRTRDYGDPAHVSTLRIKPASRLAKC